MNGRLYDPQLRRFLSPDNYVQDTENTQNYNRFGYVYNNPLLYTDPSGELAILAVIAIAVIMNGINNMANGIPFWHGMGKTMVMSAITGGITAGIGAAANAAFSASTTVGKALFQAGLHGIVGGVMSSIEGGSFESGFAAGAISSLVSSGIGALGETGEIGVNADKSTYAVANKFGKSGWFKATMIASAGLSGGLSSSIAGGNFWAGARQGVIVATMNHLAHMGFDKSGENFENEDDINQEDPPTKKKPTLDEIARSEGYTNHQFKLLYELNEFCLKVANFRAELTTFGTVTRGAKLLPLLSRSKIAVTFGENANQLNHTFRHVEALGLSRDVVKTAVLNHIPKVAKNLPFGVSVNTRIVVSGQEIIYSSYKRPSGVINVGRITGP